MYYYAQFALAWKEMRVDMSYVSIKKEKWGQKVA